MKTEKQLRRLFKRAARKNGQRITEEELKEKVDIFKTMFPDECIQTDKKGS